MELKGSKTEKNLMEENLKLEINIPILHQKQKKKVMFKLVRFLRKLPITKKNMQRFGSNCYKAVALAQLLKT